MNVNTNNLLVNVTDNALLKSGTQGLNNGGVAFINMIAAQMQNGSITDEKSLDDKNIMDANMMNLILGVNLNKNMPISDTVISNADMKNILQSDKEGDKKIAEGLDSDNLMAIVFGIPQDIANSNAQNITSQIQISNSGQAIQQDVNSDNSIINGSVENSGSLGNFEKLESSKSYGKFESYGGNIKDLINPKVPVNNELAKSNSPIKIDVKSKLQSDIDNQGTKIIDSNMIEDADKMKGTDTKSSSFKESLFDEVKKSKENFKDETDSSRIAIVDNNDVIAKNNKIIEVSDKSSEIKTSVLSQVKDQIVLMEKDGMKHVIMKLSPENLGEIDIKMSFEKGKMNVELWASNKETEKILASHADELTNGLGRSNDMYVNVAVKSRLDQPYPYEHSNSGLNYKNNENQDTNRKNYTNNKSKEENNEENIITEMINLRNLKLNKVV